MDNKVKVRGFDMIVFQKFYKFAQKFILYTHRDSFLHTYIQHTCYGVTG